MKRYERSLKKGVDSSLLRNGKVILVGFGNSKLREVGQDLWRIGKTIRDFGYITLQPPSISWQEEEAATKEISTLPKVNESEINFSVIAALSSGTARPIVRAHALLPKPVMIWAVPSRFALASAAIAAGALKSSGLGKFLLVARKSNDKRAIAQFRRWLKSGCGIKAESRKRAGAEKIDEHGKARHGFQHGFLFKKKIGLIGDVAPGMIASTFDQKALCQRFGFELVRIETSELDAVLGAKTDYQNVESMRSIWDDAGVRETTLKTFEKAAAFDSAIITLQKEHDLEALALECWTKLVPKYGTNPCFGHFRNLLIGCEGDLVMTIASMAMQHLSGSPPFLGDIVSIDYERNLISISHCSAPVQMSVSSPDIIQRLPFSAPNLKAKTAFAGVRFPNNQVVTIFRLFGRDGGKAHITTGTIKNSDHKEGPLVVNIRLRSSVERFAKLLCGNHYLISYGDNEKNLRDLLNDHGVVVL